MRRVMLLALLALVLPTAALATSIKYETGTFISGTIKSNFTNPFHLEVVGSLNTIRLDMVSLVGCSATATVCTFGSGTLTITQGGTTIFTSSVTSGILTHTIVPGVLNLVTISASLVPSTTVGSGSLVSFTAFVNGGSLTSNSSATALVTSPIPEPGTLGLLGTGLVGLAGMARRKLKSWT